MPPNNTCLVANTEVIFLSVEPNLLNFSSVQKIDFLLSKVFFAKLIADELISHPIKLISPEVLSFIFFKLGPLAQSNSKITLSEYLLTISE